MRIVVTGAAGFVGTRLRESLAKRDDIELVCLSRRRIPGRDKMSNETWYKLDFSHYEELMAIDDKPIDALVHLGAVTGGCSEHDGIEVNAQGTRVLMRFAEERGCKNIVLASSIAVTGCQDPDYFPPSLPITEDQPCLDRHGYGFSKHLMEEVSRYHCRKYRDARVINLRLAGLRPDGYTMKPPEMTEKRGWYFNRFCTLSVNDAVLALELALDSDRPPGERVYFVGPPRSAVQEPVAEHIANAWGDEHDLSYFKQPGKERAPLFCVDRIREELGFVAQDLPDWL